MNSEVRSFLTRLQALPAKPGVNLDSVLSLYTPEEAELRRLFVEDRDNTRLTNLHVGLIDIFDVPDGLRKTRARFVKDDVDLTAKHVFPLPQERRRKDGELCMTESLNEFEQNWNIFTEGSFSQFSDWNNVVAAGGSILACLLPVPLNARGTKSALREYFHSSAFPSSDVDLFLYDLTPDQAEDKMKQIYEAIRSSVPWEVTCVRTKNAVTIHCQYPYRPVQIIAKLYKSPAEILMTFDVDSACFAYDGNRVFALPRALVALVRQANTIDLYHRSTSYEIRLAKYAARGFEVYIPDLRRDKINPLILERGHGSSHDSGLTRLLILEHLGDESDRNASIGLRAMKKSKTVNKNNYDTGPLHIPYGLGWCAKRIEELIYAADFRMNYVCSYGRRLHRHTAFFGSMEECLEDLCDHCPSPQDDEERAQQDRESKYFVRGRISFLEVFPGRQVMKNEKDSVEWVGLTYLPDLDQDGHGVPEPDGIK